MLELLRRLQWNASRSHHRGLSRHLLHGLPSCRLQWLRMYEINAHESVLQLLVGIVLGLIDSLVGLAIDGTVLLFVENS